MNETFPKGVSPKLVEKPPLKELGKHFFTCRFWECIRDWQRNKEPAGSCFMIRNNEWKKCFLILIFQFLIFFQNFQKLKLFSECGRRFYHLITSTVIRHFHTPLKRRFLTNTTLHTTNKFKILSVLFCQGKAPESQ